MILHGVNQVAVHRGIGWCERHCPFEALRQLHPAPLRPCMRCRDCCGNPAGLQRKGPPIGGNRLGQQSFSLRAIPRLLVASARSGLSSIAFCSSAMARRYVPETATTRRDLECASAYPGLSCTAALNSVVAGVKLVPCQQHCPQAVMCLSMSCRGPAPGRRQVSFGFPSRPFLLNACPRL